MMQGHEHEAMVLEVLKRAVAEALERKRKLGQYAVLWRDGRAVFIWADAPGDQDEDLSRRGGNRSPLV